MEEKSPER